MIKVVVTGSECTGKTTLANALAAQLGAVVVPEYARLYVEKLDRALDYADVEAIARGQMELENAAIRCAPEVLVLDTDLLSTWVYSNHYYGRAPGWLDREVTRRRADLYLLAATDVPWVADGLQRDRGHMRAEIQLLFRSELESRGCEMVEMWGPLEHRLAASLEVVRAHLEAGSR